MATVTVEIPEGLCATLHRSPREVEKEVRLASAIEWYRQGRISQGRAAEIAGIPRADFLDALAARKIEAIQITPEELEQEVDVLRSGSR
jgi:predicted HTH domain antitoxin